MIIFPLEVCDEVLWWLEDLAMGTSANRGQL